MAIGGSPPSPPRSRTARADVQLREPDRLHDRGGLLREEEADRGGGPDRDGDPIGPGEGAALEPGVEVDALGKFLDERDCHQEHGDRHGHRQCEE